LGKLNQRTALVLGAGTIGEQVISQLRDREVAHLYVMNRSQEKAGHLAVSLGARWFHGEIGSMRLALPDLVVSSVSSDDQCCCEKPFKHAMVAGRIARYC